MLRRVEVHRAASVDEAMNRILATPKELVAKLKQIAQ
jgi:hypothetical protein